MSVAGLISKSKYSKKLLRVGAIGQNAPYTILSSSGVYIILPLPNDVRSSTPISWEQAELGLAGLAAGIGVEKASNSIGDTLNVFKENAVHGGKKALTELVVGESGKGIVEKSSGEVLNANKQMLFKGVDFRQFSLSWVLIPLDKKDSRNIKDVVKQIQKTSLPDFSSSSRIMKYPDSWNVKFKNGEYLPHIQPVCVTSVSVDYSGPGKLVLHPGGGPYQVNLSVNFVEMEIMSKKKADSFYG